MITLGKTKPFSGSYFATVRTCCSFQSTVRIVFWIVGQTAWKKVTFDLVRKVFCRLIFHKRNSSLFSCCFFSGYSCDLSASIFLCYTNPLRGLCYIWCSELRVELPHWKEPVEVPALPAFHTSMLQSTHYIINILVCSTFRCQQNTLVNYKASVLLLMQCNADFTQKENL